MTITLAEYVKGDNVLLLLGSLHATGEVIIDFSQVRRITPVGLVTLAASITRWHRNHVAVLYEGIIECQIRDYLQRMDLFKVIGFDMNETFTRHNSRGRFVPVRLIDHRVDEIGYDIALCLAPGGDDYGHPLCGLYDVVWYVFTELGNNVRQHSRGTGYAAAQVERHEGLVKIAIADNGQGIRQSFIDAELQWADALDDAQAIEKAIEPKISSKGQPANEGVGLTLVFRLIQLAGGWMLVASGSGYVLLDSKGNRKVGRLPKSGAYDGTVVALTFRQDKVRDFARLLEQAKIETGLLQPPAKSVRFVP